MKIISKYKDYYDYLSGVYGMDEKVVLDRRVGFSAKTQLHNVIKLYICGFVYDGLVINGNVYWGESIRRFSTDKPKHSLGYDDESDFMGDNFVVYNVGQYNNRYYLGIKPYKDVKNLNDKEGCPILWKNYSGWYYTDSVSKFPKLEELGVASVLPAHDLYLMLVEWLSRTAEVTDDRSDKLKLQAAGFDNITSFRKM